MSRQKTFEHPQTGISKELALFRKCCRLIEERRPDIKLSRGVPDSQMPMFRMPQKILAIAAEDIMHGRMPYSAPEGDKRLRRAFATYVNKILHLNSGVRYEEDGIACTRGALEGIFLAMYAISKTSSMKKHVKILIPKPVYPELIDKAMLFGEVELIEPETLLRSIGSGVTTIGLDGTTTLDSYEFPLAEEIRNRLDNDGSIRMILLTMPNNPTGLSIPKEELDRIIKNAREKGVYVVFDESGDNYTSRYSYVHEWPESIAFENVVRVRTFSKEICIAGAREELIGFVLADKRLIENISILYEAMFGCPSTIFVPMLITYIEALYYARTPLQLVNKSGIGLVLEEREGAPEIKELAEEVGLWETNRHIQMDELRSILFEFHRTNNLVDRALGTYIHPEDQPGGSCNAFLQFKTNETGFELFQRLLDQGVATMPGECFGVDSGAWLRITYAVPEQELIEGIRRIKEALR